MLFHFCYVRDSFYLFFCMCFFLDIHSKIRINHGTVVFHKTFSLGFRHVQNNYTNYTLETTLLRTQVTLGVGNIIKTHSCSKGVLLNITKYSHGIAARLVG